MSSFGYEAVGSWMLTACSFWDISTKLIASAQLAVHPPKVGKNGLQGVLEGLEDLRLGKVSGVKLVYRVNETP